MILLQYSQVMLHDHLDSSKGTVFISIPRFVHVLVDPDRQHVQLAASVGGENTREDVKSNAAGVGDECGQKLHHENYFVGGARFHWDHLVVNTERQRTERSRLVTVINRLRIGRAYYTVR